MGVGLIASGLSLHFTELSSLQTFSTIILPCSSLRAYLSVSPGASSLGLGTADGFVSGYFHYLLFPLLWLQSSPGKAPAEPLRLFANLPHSPVISEMWF